MKFLDQLKYLKHELRRGKLEEVLNRLYDLFEGAEEEKQIILKESRYISLKNDIENQLITYEEGQVGKNILVKEILELIDKAISDLSDNEIFQSLNVFIPEQASQEKDKVAPTIWNWLLMHPKLLFFGGVFLLIYSFYFFSNILNESFDEKDHRVLLLFQCIFAVCAIPFSFQFRKFTLTDPARITTEEKELRDTLRLSRYSQLVSTETNRNILWKIYKEKVNETIKLFTYGWASMWILWGCLYMLLIFKSDNDSGFTLFQDLLNYLGTGAFVFMYVTLSKSTSKGQYKKWIYGIVISVLLLIVFEVLVNSIINPNNTIWQIDKAVLFWYRLFIGFFAAASFSTVFGRLTSKFIDIPVEITVLLFFYAAIQPFYAILGVDGIKVSDDYNLDLDLNTLVGTVIFLAFTLKVFLLITITWILRSGRLLFFVVQEGSINFIQDEKLIDLLENTNTEL